MSLRQCYAKRLTEKLKTPNAQTERVGAQMSPKSRLFVATVCLVALGFRPSPDTSAKIAFASHRDGNWEIYSMNADGSRQTRLTTRDVQDRFPLWSPDRSKIAFGSQVSSGWELWVMNADGTVPRLLCKSIVAKAARQWSPDGKRIALTVSRDGNLDIYTVRADGGGLSRLTSSAGDDRDPSWSPDR